MRDCVNWLLFGAMLVGGCAAGTRGSEHASSSNGEATGNDGGASDAGDADAANSADSADSAADELDPTLADSLAPAQGIEDRDLTRALHARPRERLEPVGAPRALADGRVLVVAMARSRTAPANPTFTVIVLARGAQGWRATGRVDLPTPRLWVDPHPDHPLADFLEPSVKALQEQDYDGDGVMELGVRVEYGSQTGAAVGYHTLGHFFVLHESPALALAADALVIDVPQAEVEPKQQGQVVWQDRNGDAHADLVVRGQRCELPDGEGAEPVCTPFEQVQLWNATRHGWDAAPAGQ